MKKNKVMPRYPIYVPSKGRYEKNLTANFLIKDGVPFKLVIEKEEYDDYASKYGENRLLVLPFSNQGSVIPARNWIKTHATEAGYERHWQLDDNMRDIKRFWKGRRVKCPAGVGLRATEDFADRYENVAIAGLNYEMFCVPVPGLPPFRLNVHVYSCSLILNSLPHKFRGRFNEDTDLCLQVLADGWCTVLINAFMVRKMITMQHSGGNTDALYKYQDGRLKMSRSLERLWPGVAKTTRRFNRPQHSIHSGWRKFDTPLKLKPGIDLSKMKPNEYGMELKQVADEIKSPSLRALYEEQRKQ